MTATLPRLLVEWIDRGHAEIVTPCGVNFGAVCDGGWHTVCGPDDTRSFDEFEGLLGWLQEELS